MLINSVALFWCWYFNVDQQGCIVLMLINSSTLFLCWLLINGVALFWCCAGETRRRMLLDDVGSLRPLLLWNSRHLASASEPHTQCTVKAQNRPTQCTLRGQKRPKKEQKCCEVAPLRQLIKKLNHACINNQIRSKQKLRFYIICKSEEDYRLVLQCDVQPLQVPLKIFWGFLAGEPQVFPNWHLYILCSTQT